MLLFDMFVFHVRLVPYPHCLCSTMGMLLMFALVLASIYFKQNCGCYIVVNRWNNGDNIATQNYAHLIDVSHSWLIQCFLGGTNHVAIKYQSVMLTPEKHERSYETIIILTSESTHRVFLKTWCGTTITFCYLLWSNIIKKENTKIKKKKYRDLERSRQWCQNMCTWNI